MLEDMVTTSKDEVMSIAVADAAVLSMDSDSCLVNAPADESRYNVVLLTLIEDDSTSE